MTKAVEIVIKGGAYMSPSIAREIVDYFIKGKAKKPAIQLKGRQQEIMDLMIAGKTYDSIARELYIAVDTVRYHIKSLYKTLHASNKAEAIANYLRSSS